MKTCPNCRTEHHGDPKQCKGCGMTFPEEVAGELRSPFRPTPPSLEEVMAAGYGEDVAKGIVAKEQAKFAAGEKPYGDKEPEGFLERLGEALDGETVSEAPDENVGENTTSETLQSSEGKTKKKK